LREQTDDEKDNVEKLNELKKTSGSKNKKGEYKYGQEGRRFSEKLGKFIKRYEKMIDKIKDGEKNSKQLEIINKALGLWKDPDKNNSYRKEVKSGAWKAGQAKCNKFVGDVLGKDAKLEDRNFWFTGNRYPRADEWADERKYNSKFPVISYIFYGGVSLGKEWRKPEPGDIVSHGLPGGGSNTAHVGINLSDDVYISATENKKYGQTGGVIIKLMPKDAKLTYRDVSGKRPNITPAIMDPFGRPYVPHKNNDRK